jgi:hypothetical protein
MSVKRSFTAAAMCASFAMLAGCVAPAMVATAGLSVAQTGAATWLEGDLVGTYNEEYPDMVWACDAAAKQLALNVRVRRVDEKSAYMYFEDDDGVDVDITLKRRTSRLCQITIRVGVWGNKPLSSLFLGMVEQQLSARHADAPKPHDQRSETPDGASPSP